MNDVQQILTWEKQRKACEWWYHLSIEERWNAIRLNGFSQLEPEKWQIVIMYDNR